MTKEEVDSVNAERMTNWGVYLNGAHATAALLVAVGHDDHSGEIHVMLPENISAEWAGRVLQRCIEMLAAGQYYRD